MKKILAMLLALSLVFALAACGGNTAEDTTAAPDTTVADTEAPAADTTAVAPTEAATEAATEATTEAATEAATEANAIPQTTEEIVAYYNAAVIKTNDAGAPKGQSTMKLLGDITGDGALGAILKVAMPIIESTLEKSSSSTDYIPGKGALKASDVTSASAKEDGKGNIIIELKTKEQTDGPQADADTAGPVARAVGTLGNINNAIEALGAELYSGADTIKLTYNDCYIKATVNQESGKITTGTWHYKVNIHIGDASIKLGLKFNAKNLKGVIDYTVAI